MKRFLSLLLTLTMVLGIAAIAPAEEANGAAKYTWDKEVDVVVVGFGLAGAAACVEIADIAPDSPVLLLEKMDEAQSGGNSIASGQTILNVWPDDIELFRDYLWKMGKPNNIPRDWFDWWTQEMVNQSDWIEQVAKSVGYWYRPNKYGSVTMEFPEFPGASYRARGDCLVTYPNTVSQPGGSYKAFRDVVKQLKNVEIMYETPAIALIQDADTKEVYGVTAQNKDGSTFNVRANKGVVLACGGYENNLEMQRDFHGMDVVYTAGTPGNTGDGIKMLMEAGAKIWHMKNFTQSGGIWIGVKVPDYESTFERNFFYKNGGWLEVDATGNRFYNESKKWHKQHMKINENGHWIDMATYRALPIHWICDQKTFENDTVVTTWMAWPISPMNYEWSADNSVELEKGWIIKADTIEELAEKIGRDPATLRATVDRYNEMCAKGADEDFGRDIETMAPIEEGPFYSVELTPCVVATTGGAVRNPKSQVLDWNENVIPHLYTAGELGSYVSNLYQNGTFLNECISSGRAAAQDIYGVEPHYDYKGNDYVVPLEDDTVRDMVWSSSSVGPVMNASKAKDGEYYRSSESTHGPWTMTFTVKDGKFTSFAMTEGAENLLMTEEQFKSFTDSIIEAQDLGVDAVSGCTQDSEAIVAAIQKALDASTK
ncbi:MAG: FAD-binding protein [Clostridiales bacterium]|nr:FAD-binding protein [Clostridiales bacterium]